MSRWTRRAAATIAIAIAVTVAARARPAIPSRYTSLLDRAFLSSREQRLIHYFGECEPGGYGYLKRVLTAYSRIEPGRSKRPVIRYRDYNRRSEYLFEPTRFEADPSIVVGVGLPESDLREREIGSGVRGPDGRWRFAVDSNFDLLTRVEIELQPGNSDLQLRLYRNEKESTPAWTSIADLTTRGESGTTTVEFVSTPPLRQFRYGLVDPFVIQVEGSDSVSRVTIYGVIVDMQGYRIVHRNGGCFTAVENRQIDRWTQLIRELENSND